MDTNLMSCPTCGHSVSNAAGACAYCGATMVEEVQQSPADDKDVGENAQVVAFPPPLPQEKVPSADIIAEEVDEIPIADVKPAESNVSQLAADSSVTAETSEPATETEIVSADESVYVDDAVESPPPDDEQDLKSEPQSGQLIQDAGNVSEIVLSEAVELESVPAAEPAVEEKRDIQEPEAETTPAIDNAIPIAREGIQTETDTNDIQPNPAPEVVDLAGDEIGESETLGETIAELVEIEASQQASQSPSALENSPPPEKSVGEPETKPAEDILPKKDAGIAVDAKAGSISESSGDTILLDMDAEVEPAAGGLPDTIAESAIAKSGAGIQQKNRQKANLAKAQALKKQKAALAMAQARKKQQLILAKAAALKRKKAAQAKVRADIEAAKRDVSAVAAAVMPKPDPGREADTGMQTLLEKYKGRVIGINYDNSAEIREAQLVEANAEYFSVFVKDQKLHYSYPLNAVLTLIEGKDGVDIGNSKQSKKFIAVIKVYPLVLF